MDALDIDGAWIGKPQVHQDDRGSFLESFRADEIAASTGHSFEVVQINSSISHRGVIRGIHFADVPPGQAKYVSCVRGAIMDVIVDVRVGSPGFGSWTAVRLDDKNRHSVFLAEGLGHGFMALTDECTVTYLCSAPYAPGREHGIHPLDSGLGIEWPSDVRPVLSAKDAAAPSLAQASRDGLLPSYAACVEYYASRRDYVPTT